MNIHRQLTLAQLRDLAARKKNLLQQTAYVREVLIRLHPGADEDRARKDVQLAALERMWEFVEPLEPVHNSLKACVLYHILRLERAKGEFNKPRFLTYLKLPRNIGYMNPDYLRREEHRQHLANLSHNFDVVLLSPIRGDEPLVREFLEEFFVEEDSYKPYLTWLRESFVKPVFAETKILHGIGDSERWASLLSPDHYRRIKERIEVNMEPENPEFIAPEDSVSLRVTIKNVPELRIKLFKINTFNYYREKKSPINLAIDLDGLVASDERLVKYEQAPEIRHHEEIEFPALTGQRGVWVAELIGNGISSRALIQKGRLDADLHTTPGGLAFFVSDQDGKPVNDATIWMSGREYEPEGNGAILVPYSTHASQESLIVRQRDFCSLVMAHHPAENYQLSTQILVDHEALLEDAEADIVVRPVLRLNGQPMPLQLLDKLKITAVSQNIQGIESRREFTRIDFDPHRELRVVFDVPPEMVNLRVEFSAEVRNRSQSKDITLRGQQNFPVNRIDQTALTEQTLFTPAPEGWVCELRGKNGEIIADRPVKVQVQPRDFNDSWRGTLQTDADGKIDLGKLPGIRWVRVENPRGQPATLHIPRGQAELPGILHGAAESTLTFAVPPDIDGARLYSLRLNHPEADVTKGLKVKDGLMTLPALPAGDYRLLLSDRQVLHMRLTEGATRRLQVNRPAPLQITKISTTKDKVKVQLVNAAPGTRVHVRATHFEPDTGLFEQLGASLVPDPTVQRLARTPSFYESGRNIGDEYRYILDRAAGQKYPGNMLTRPGLLLNPWARRSTSSVNQTAAKGNDYGGAAANAAMVPPAATPKQDSQMAASQSGFETLDWLAQPTLLLVNLSVDEDGLVEIDRGLLDGQHRLEILALDVAQAVSRIVVLPRPELATADRRLLKPLDPEVAFTEQKKVLVVKKGEDLTLRNAIGGTAEVIDTLPKAFNLLRTLCQAPGDLEKFNFLLTWHQMDEVKQRETYSEFACHELHFWLYHKDPEFFDHVVKPYLANKREKTFIDHWLLEHDLERYLEPWAFNRLNVVERILLGRRIPAQHPVMQHYMERKTELIVPDLAAEATRFETALGSLALFGDDSGSVSSRLRYEAIDGATRLDAPAVEFDDEFAAGTTVTDALKRRSNFRRMRGLALAPGQELAEKEMAKHFKGAERQKALNKKMSAIKAGKLVNQLGDRDEDGLAITGGLLMEGAFIDVGGKVSFGRNARRLYEKLDATKEWAENNYWHRLVGSTTPTMIPVNHFWADYAAHPAGQPFLSSHLAEAAHDFTEILLALAVLDLPAESGSALADIESADGAATLSFTNRAIVYVRDTRPSEPAENPRPLLVAQNFFRADDRYTMDGNERFDKFVEEEFLRGIVYGGQILLSNPTSSRQKLSVLYQIPKGAMPVSNGRVTQGHPIVLDPFGIKTFEYFFYFPAVGNFPHAPVTAAVEEKLVARAPAHSFKVVEKLSRIDTESWDYISQQGTDAQVIKFLQSHNIDRLDLDWIAFRMKDKAFFDKIIQLLDAQHVYAPTLWSYGLYHQDTHVARSWLLHSGLPRRVGPSLDTELLTVDHRLHLNLEHFEYAPLVNPRAHRLSETRHIDNEALHAHYHRFLETLAWKQTFDDEDKLGITYFLALQDRIGEALLTFSDVRKDEVAEHLQFDYLAAWLALRREDTAAALEFAEPHVNHPVDRWRKKFVNLVQQVKGQDQDVVDPEDRDQRMAALAATEPSLELGLEDNTMVVTYQNLTEAEIRLYPMDIELLFSRSPFVQDESTRFSFVEPAYSQVLQLNKDDMEHRLAVPQKFRRANVLAEVAADGLRRTQAIYANELTVQVIETYGQVSVLHAQSDKPLPITYVKVFARMKDGSVKFFKDGYTDFRGRFDYVSLNTNELENVERFSLLVLHEKHGAMILEAAPPKR